MSKYDFLKQVEEQLLKRPEMAGLTVDSSVCIRNNDIKKHGISIRKGDEAVSPVFYVDSYYEDYARKKNTLDEVVDAIISSLRRVQMSKPKIDPGDLSFESCKDRITFRLVSAKRNQMLLKDLPYIPFLDLAIIFTITWWIAETGVESIKITNGIMESWGIDAAGLMSYAVKNTPKLFPPRFTSLYQLLQDQYGFPKLEGMEDGPVPLYLLSNESLVNGATTLLYEDAMCRLGEEIGDDFYILPSSIHEVLVLPAGDMEAFDMDEMKKMVKEINKEHVGAEDVLSDQVYFYKKNEKRFYF